MLLPVPTFASANSASDKAVTVSEPIKPDRPVLVTLALTLPS